MDVLANRRIGGENVFLWFVIFIGMAASLLMGMLVGADPIRTVVLLVTIIAAVTWISAARTGWWLLVPALAGVGGYFYFGFKIYPHELALLGGVIPLAL